MLDDTSPVGAAEPTGVDLRLVLVGVATALTLPIHWHVWGWDFLPSELAIPMLICALPLVSRRGRALLAGLSCVALMCWVLLTSVIGGGVFLPQVVLLLFAAVPVRARWGVTVLALAIATAGFLHRPEQVWREVGWVCAVMLIAVLRYGARRLPRVAH